jgi:hypothetical protein
LIGESATNNYKRTAYTYSGATSCQTIKVVIVSSNYFYLDKLDSGTTVVRKEDNTGTTIWAKQLTELGTGEMAVASDESNVYTRLYHTSENVGYMIQLDGSTGAFVAAIKGYDSFTFSDFRRISQIILIDLRNRVTSI